LFLYLYVSDETSFIITLYKFIRLIWAFSNSDDGWGLLLQSAVVFPKAEVFFTVNLYNLQASG